MGWSEEALESSSHPVAVSCVVIMGYKASSHRALESSYKAFNDRSSDHFQPLLRRKYKLKSVKDIKISICRTIRNRIINKSNPMWVLGSSDSHLLTSFYLLLSCIASLTDLLLLLFSVADGANPIKQFGFY